MVALPSKSNPISIRSSFAPSGFARAGCALFGVAVLALSLAGCQSASLYAPAAKANGIGYRDTKIEQNRFQIIFRSRSDLDQNRAYGLALRRAAEVTLANQFGWFQIIHPEGILEREPAASPNASGAKPALASYPTGRNGVEYAASDRQGYPEIRLQILAGTGTKPDHADYYDASEVLSFTASALPDRKDAAGGGSSGH